MEYVKVLEGRQSVLLASLISLGLERPWVERAAGLPYGVEHHRYASHAHQVSSEDLDRLREAVRERMEAGPQVWTDYAERCSSAGDKLAAAARSLAELARTSELGSSRPEPAGTNREGPSRAEPAETGGQDPSRAGSPGKGGEELLRTELAEGFAAFVEASKEAAPFVVVMPIVQSALESLVDQALAGEAPDDAARERARRGLRELVVRAGEPEAVRESRAFYGLVLEAMDEDEVTTLLRSTSPKIAVERIRTDFPALYGTMRDHARAYGWLRAPGHGSAPQSAKELVERMQAVVLRWTAEIIRAAAQPDPEPDLEAALGFPPSPSLARLVGSLRTVAALECSRVGVHRRAAAVASGFFEKVARAVEPAPPSPEHLLFATAGEIEAALTGKTPFPAAEAAARMSGSFTIERTGDAGGGGGNLRASAVEPTQDRSDSAGTEPLTGMTASRGRATGRVKVILAAPQVHELGVGDVLVTATSTPDAIGGESVFPTRAGPRDGIGHVAAIVTDEGGFLSHAAIVAREQGIPCIVGTERATSELRDGQVVEVDATQAIGRIIPWGP